MGKYPQVGIEFWGGGDKTISEFKKALRTIIPPKEMDEYFKYVKSEYKKQFPTKVKASKD